MRQNTYYEKLRGDFSTALYFRVKSVIYTKL